MASDSKAVPDQASRRRQIARAALNCFRRSGFHGASMQDICAEAGMSAGALYRYFPSKAAIIVAIAEAERESHALMFQPLEEAADPLAALQELGANFIRQQLDGTSELLTADVLAEAARNPDVKAALERNAAFAHETVTRALLRGQDLGVVDPDLDVAAACHLIIALGDGLCTQLGGPAQLSADRIVQALQTMLQRFCRPVGGRA